MHKTQICNSPFSIRAKQTTTTLNGVPWRVCKHCYRSFDCSAYQDRYDTGGPVWPRGPLYLTFPYISVLNEHAPIVERRVKTMKQPPWFNADLARLIMARARLFEFASIDTAHFSKSWKARVVPLYKSGDSNDIINYIPIYILQILSKLLERHVHNHLYAYLTYYKLLLDEQSSFRENRSCEIVLFKFTDYVLNNVDTGSICSMMLVDLRKVLI